MRWRRLGRAGLIAICAVLLVSPVLALAPDKVFHNYVRDSWSIEQGLPQMAVSAVSQDRDGYIWAGTLSGLARFDGVRFTAFTPANTPALPSGAIQTLRNDSNGRMWIGTQKGLAYRDHGRFVAVPLEQSASGAELDVQDVMPTASGEVLVATSTGLFHVVGERLQPIANVPGPLYALSEHDNHRWVGGWGGVYRLEGSTAEFEGLPGLGLHDTVLHLVATRDRLWAGTTAGLYFREAGQWRRYDGEPALAESQIGVMYEDSDRNLWVGTQSGLARLRNGVLTEMVDNERMGTRWEYLAAFEDREGNLWLGSRTRGLTRLWNGLATRYTTQEGLVAPQVWSLDQDSGERSGDRIWVGTENGLSLLDHGRFVSVVAGSALPDPNVYSLLAGPDHVWLGTLRGAAMYRKGKLERPASLTALEGLRINGIFRDSKRRLWFATSNGLYRYADNGMKRYGEPEGLADPSVRLVFETRGGRLLLGTQFGLAEFAGERIQMLGDEAAGLPVDIDVTAIHELADGRIVVGTATEQLFVSDNGHWVEFNHDSGLPQNSAFFITDDGRGHLWVAGIRGIYRVPIDELRWRPGSPPARLHGEIFRNSLASRSTGQRGECCNGAGNGRGFLAKGLIWLPTRDGVLAVPTDDIANNPVPPTVVVESVTDSRGSHPAGTAGPVQLPAASRDLSFKFTALSFQDPDAVQLQYRLRGYDKDWRLLKDSSSREVSYTNLPPGDYTFEVRGANNAGVWSDAPAALPFGVAHHFHETPSFFILVCALLALMIYLGYRWQLSALTKRRVHLENLVAQRTDALAVANQRLEKASYTDPLTGLRNRRYLINQLPQDLAFYRRKGAELYEQDHIVLFAVVDIDHFKQINDRFGHGGGDLVLQQFSTLLSDLVRIGDYVTRWGGEEFLIVSRPLPRDNAIAYVSRMCTVIEKHEFLPGNASSMNLTCSIGFAEYPLQKSPLPLDWEQLIELADRALYYVKGAGRNGWASYRFTASTPFPTLMQNLKDHRDELLADGRLKLLSSFDLPVSGLPGPQGLVSSRAKIGP